jgi:hypothetical protein
MSPLNDTDGDNTDGGSKAMSDERQAQNEIAKCRMTLLRSLRGDTKIRKTKEDRQFQVIVATSLAGYLAKPARKGDCR